MSYIPPIVQGEASESDSDQENSTVEKVQEKNIRTIPHGVVVTGEAPESDEEQVDHSPTNDAASKTSSAKNLPKIGDSLLHRKLCECNVSLRNNVVNLLKETIQNSLEQLTSAEQELINSQVRLQRASAAIRALSNSGGLLSKKLAMSGNYLPNINIALSDPTS